MIQLMQDQFDSLIQLRTPSRPMELQGLMIAPSPSSVPLTYPNLPSFYNNAKYKDNACKAIKPPYDGSEENLIPFFTLLNIRQKHEGWQSATFCGITLLLYFAHVPEQEILQKLRHDGCPPLLTRTCTLLVTNSSNLIFSPKFFAHPSPMIST